MATSNFVIEYGLTVGSTEIITSAGKLVASAISTLDSDDLTEGSTNLFFTNARARAALSVAAGGDLAYNSGTGVFTLATVNGGTF
tara:strand:- start:248 stop:502 length:255 start_codon:yes stop_codon:yes gene_type:complete